MKKLLITLSILTTGFITAAPMVKGKNGGAQPAQPVVVQPAAPVAVAEQVIVNLVKQSTELTDPELLSILTKIAQLASQEHELDIKVKQYKALYLNLKKIKFTRLAPSTQREIAEVLTNIIADLDSKIQENSSWFSDTYQVSDLKDCRANYAELLGKFHGGWLSFRETLTSFGMKHWRKAVITTFITVPALLAKYSSMFKNTKKSGGWLK